MISDESAEEIAVRAKAALADGKAIEWGESFPDKDFAEISWARYGLLDTNEIVVVASVGKLILGIAHLSRLAYPVMDDRRFGIDVEDQRLSLWLSARLWEIHSDKLREEALRIRTST